MKKLILSLVAILMMAGVAHAQKLGYGGRIGLNMATTSNSGFSDDDSKLNPGLQIAGFANFSILDILAIQPEIAFTQKGNRIKSESALFGDADFRTNFNYLQINALGQLRFGKGVKILVNLGPYFGYAVSGNNVSIIDGDRDSDSIDNWDGTNRSDVGVIMGTGVEVPLGFARLVVDARFGLGLTSIVEDANDPVSNRVLQLGVGLMFGR